MNFRLDINGLRAIAVIAVVLFHFNPIWVPGGFAGVDVFFVISGFLMTKIIFQGFDKNNFNLIKFYLARANRIIPALSIMCFTVFILGYLLIIQSESFNKLAHHIFSSTFFFSNITYYLESGYFDADSKDKWLLHTWSLSVEWQFYIIYPIVLIILKRYFTQKHIKNFIVVGAILGFIFSIFATNKWPTFAYYQLSTRAWEMLIGGIAFLYPFNFSDKKNKFIVALGLILILISYACFSSKTPWPGYFSLLPVIGSYLIIIANQQSIFITNNSFFQHIGKWSYSIYLWHWPLVSLSYLYSFNTSNKITVLMFLLSVFLGWVSFTLFEGRKYKYSFLIFLPLVITALIIIKYEIKPLKFHYIKSIAESIERKPYDCFDQKGQSSKDIVVCKLSDGEHKVVALGDSHMYSSLPVLDKLSLSNDIELSYVGFSGCPPLLNIFPIRGDQKAKNCHELNKKAMDYVIANNINTVYLAARWTYYTEGSYLGNNIQLLSRKSSGDKGDKNLSIEAFKVGLKNTLKSYNDIGVKVVILLQVPMQLKNPKNIYFESLNFFGLNHELVKKSSVNIDKHKKFQRFTNNIIKSEADKFTNVTLLDPTPIFCHADYCSIGNEKESFYFDDDHLSIKGSYKLQDALLPLLTH